jgi:hypothetical protein
VTAHDFLLTLALVFSVLSAGFSFMLWRALARATSVDVLAALKVVSDRVAELHARKSPLSSSFENDALEVLRRLDERVAAPLKPTLPSDQQSAFFDRVVAEAYEVGEKMGAQNAANGLKVTGSDKQREAVRYMRDNLAVVQLNPDEFMSTLAKKLEAHVALKKHGGQS